MFSDKYSSESLFPYAEGYYYGILPRGVLEDRDIGKSSIHIENDYIIYFKENTPEDIKQRFIKDYKEYYVKKKKEQLNGIFRD